MAEEVEEKKVRIFIGGLGEGVSTQDLQRLFSSLGTVEGIETIRTKGRSFAYLDFLTDPKSLSKLFSTYNGCLWKGGKLKLEKAKEHYLARLKREREQEALDATQPPTTAPNDSDNTDSNTKHLRIFFPRLRKMKSIPFSGTGKHKYSFQNIIVPPLPVHFCDCEEHCSPFVTRRQKQSFDQAAESGGMNDEEINIMNAVMNKLLEKEKVSKTKHLGEEQDALESPDALHVNECEVDSATDEDDLIINVETKKNKAALKGRRELERILENQELWSNITKIAKEEPKNIDDKIKNVKKKKSLPKLEKQRGLSSTPGGMHNLRTLPEEVGSGAQPTKPDDDFEESPKVSWSQKSSWKELLGDRGSTTFSASLILPKSDSGENQQNRDDLCAPLSTNNKTENMDSDGYPGSKPTNVQVIKELTEAQRTNEQVIQDLAKNQHTTGRGASWLQKQSWTQLVGENSNSFSISQVLPGLNLPEPMIKEPIVDPANSNDHKHNYVAKDITNEVVDEGLNLGEIVPGKSKHADANDIASAPVVEKKIETKPREESTEAVEIGQTCSFMRNAASIKEWAKAKAALSGSLKRKRGEK
ncbi:hypothetical protein RJT34_26410 [Clitoria ternatea]|uniref:RRM domain-containing protein n=1 Tax=Clitoria ternatea TaxID=43366 RepID=A0AAN9FFJ9_CLITE